MIAAGRFWPLLSALALACGSNRPEPPDWLEAPESCSGLDYPEGPFGAEPGDVARDACFRGWLEPHRVERSEATLAPVALSDFYDPDGKSDVKLLMINTAALWCSACRIEHETLPAHAEELRPRGLLVLTALFQGLDHDPATLDDMTLWAKTYATNFPLLLDPRYSFKRYASAETAPLNLVVDPRTMRVLEKYIGDQSAVLWPFIEGELARRP